MIIILNQSLVYSTPNPFTLRAPSIFSFKESDDRKDWSAIENDYRILIETAFSEEELKRVYRKMAMEVHPDHNKGDEKKAEEVFKNLAEKIEKKLKKDFKIVSEDFDTGEKDLHWMDLWASVSPQYELDNDIIMKESVEKLKERASRLNKVISETDLVVKFLAERAAYLPMDEIDRLLDMTSKRLFASELLSMTQKTAISVGNISDEDIWKVRPLLERLYLANQLRAGEVVFIRNENKIRRTVILEPLSGEGSRLKAITVGAPFKGVIDYDLGAGYSIFIELTPKEIVSGFIDFEREPKQEGYPINIGDILEIDLGDGAPFRVTVYGVYAHYCHAITHKPHNNLEYRLGYGYDFGTYAGEDALNGKLGNQRITKIELPIPPLKPRMDSAEIQLKVPKKELRRGS